MYRVIVMIIFFIFLFLFTLLRYCNIYYAHSLLYRDQQNDTTQGLDNWINLARRDYKTLGIPFVYYFPQSALFFIIARRPI